MSYRIEHDMTPDEVAHVQRQLVEFADRFTGPRRYRGFAIALRDDAGVAVGGITGNTVWDWLQISVLWIPEALRGRGHGHGLLVAAEALGCERGCRFARLDTFEFEARPFYEAHGYRVVARTEDFPAGHTQFHLHKTLS